MKTIQLSRAPRALAQYARELNDDIMVLMDAKRPVAAIVPLKGVDRESLALSAHPEFLELIERSRAQFAAGQTLSLDEMKKAVLPQNEADHRLQPTRKRRQRPSR
jgi:antitoxin (DNA-binding transcriptional repressor) of toxin-antitoxin stability system